MEGVFKIVKKEGIQCDHCSAIADWEEHYEEHSYFWAGDVWRLNHYCTKCLKDWKGEDYGNDI